MVRAATPKAPNCSGSRRQARMAILASRMTELSPAEKRSENTERVFKVTHFDLDKIPIIVPNMTQISAVS